jgi:hypothetical protein
LIVIAGADVRRESMAARWRLVNEIARQGDLPKGARLSRAGLPTEETAVSRLAVALKGQVSGKDQALRAAMDYVPRIATASFAELFRGLN